VVGPATRKLFVNGADAVLQPRLSQLARGVQVVFTGGYTAAGGSFSERQVVCTNLLLALVLALAFLTMPIVVKLMRRYGKRNTHIGSMMFMAVVLLIMGQVPPGGQNWMLVEQPDSALLMLRLLVSVIPAFMLVLSVLVAWRYPLSRERYYEIRQELLQNRAARRQAQDKISA
jgi:Na+/melibiose symporter-like transporter